MNNIEKLYTVYQKKERLIIGLMSGTSLDGLDIALCLFSGSGLNTKVELLNFETVAYDKSFKEEIKRVFSKTTVELELLCLLNEKVALTHAAMVNKVLQKWNRNNDEIDAIASHGQTVYHAPKSKHNLPDFPNGTLQIGDGDHLAVHTGIITLSDFRQKNIAFGAEGAPLAVYGDYLLFSRREKSVVLLNIGGISNFTFLPAENSNLKLFSTDIGPGNTLSDQFMQQYYGLYFDEDAFYARQGAVDNNLLTALFSHNFFSLSLPKSTGQELFNLNYIQSALQKSDTSDIKKEDVLATLCEFTAMSIAKELLQIDDDFQLVVSGGGTYNPLLMERLKYHLPQTQFVDIYNWGITADAKEAVLFALLANETLSGKAVEIPQSESVPAVCMGKISFPC